MPWFRRTPRETKRFIRDVARQQATAQREVRRAEREFWRGQPEVRQAAAGATFIGHAVWAPVRGQWGLYRLIERRTGQDDARYWLEDLEDPPAIYGGTDGHTLDWFQGLFRDGLFTLDQEVAVEYGLLPETAAMATISDRSGDPMFTLDLLRQDLDDLRRLARTIKQQGLEEEMPEAVEAINEAGRWITFESTALPPGLRRKIQRFLSAVDTTGGADRSTSTGQVMDGESFRQALPQLEELGLAARGPFVPDGGFGLPAADSEWMLANVMDETWFFHDRLVEAIESDSVDALIEAQRGVTRLEAEVGETIEALRSGDLPGSASRDLIFLGWAVWASPMSGQEPVRVLSQPGGSRYWFETEKGYRYGLADGYDLDEDLPTLFMAGKLSLNPDLVRSVAGPQRSAAVIFGDDGRPRFAG